jgi:predicted RNA-binding Zn-ribbon protein involved in translation (DUF1610 family)
MKINCISCGHKIDLDDCYSDYEGQIKCYVCGAIINIRTEDGSIKSAQLDHTVTRCPPDRALDSNG